MLGGIFFPWREISRSPNTFWQQVCLPNVNVSTVFYVLTIETGWEKSILGKCCQLRACQNPNLPSCAWPHSPVWITISSNLDKAGWNKPYYWQEAPKVSKNYKSSHWTSTISKLMKGFKEKMWQKRRYTVSQHAPFPQILEQGMKISSNSGSVTHSWVGMCT